MSSTLDDTSTLLFKLFRNASGGVLITLTLATLIGYFVFRTIYRLYLHPLSKFPGPKFHAVSHIPAVLATWNGEQHRRVARLHQQYGTVVRISPEEVSFIDPDAWKDIYGHGSKGVSGPHKPWSRHGKYINGATSLIIAPDADHTRMRRLFNPAFSDRALKQQEPLFLKYINLLAEKLREGIEEDPDRKFDMVKMYNFTTFDIMGDLTFGEPLQMLSKAKYDPWVTAIFRGIKAGTRLSVLADYPLVEKTFKSLIPQSVMVKKQYEHHSFAEERVAKRLEKGREHEGVDIWDLVLSKSAEKGLSRAEMDNNAGLFMLAGTETTATLVSGLTALLLDHPRTMRELSTEIRKAFSGPEEMTIEKCATLPYLNACIKEALRLYPPVAMGRPRVSAPQGSTICGHYIPPGYMVSAPHLAMSTSASNFKDPLSFVPERWLGDPRFESDKRHAVQPFHVGPRDCIGKNMAYHEMRLIMTRVLYTFDLELCEESRNWGDQNCYIIWEKKPLMCTLKAVN
ncbi:cytochrome P450 [Paraphaeosphaeria sporulosa]|uniref:Cytochrome P450 n=1 Tax=Paraphaeosphaeria sporulosa TaxID=1460663 RepID=A0A177C8H2_9PLEO|nr:cytochrome P450 [Paraphaeosphaeria sporulosa]OAG03845.1 cytochrome P450 [Paraphaeosphaeria sporulosa]